MNRASGWVREVLEVEYPNYEFEKSMWPREFRVCGLGGDRSRRRGLAMRSE